MSNLSELFQEAVLDFDDQRLKVDSSSLSYQNFTSAIPNLLQNYIDPDQNKYLIKGSVGLGSQAEIPWVCIFNKRITDSATSGLYLVYLRQVGGKGLYFILGQGITYFVEVMGNSRSKKTLSQARNAAQKFREMIKIPSRYVLPESGIDLGGTKFLGKGYEAGAIAGIYYSFENGNFPSDELLRADITGMLNLYDRAVDLMGDLTYERLIDYFLSIVEQPILVDEKGDEESAKDALPNEIIDLNVPPPVVVREAYVPEPLPRKIVTESGKECFVRDPNRIAMSLKIAKYKCEIESKHKTFEWFRVPGENYMEGHHLIPFSKQHLFQNSLDVEANIVCLCATCHRKIHFGMPEEKEKVLTELYNQRKEKLEKSGIGVSLEQLLKFYGLK